VVMPSETNPIDAIPGFDGISFPEFLASALEDHVDPGIGIVDKDVQLARLLRLFS